MIETERLLALLQAGQLTRNEVVNHLIESATKCSPAKIAGMLPPEIINELRVQSAVPPQSREDFRVVHSVCASPGFDADAYFRELSERTFDGLWRWHEYFAKE